MEQEYIDILKDVLKNGIETQTRNSITKSLFVKHMKIDLREGFPLLTTKKMFTRGIIEELLFFLKGHTQTKELEIKGVNIWKGNTCREFLDKMGFNDREEGDMGPMYGAIWKKYNQLQNVVDEIRANPRSRRLLMTTLDFSEINKGVLYPCHSLVIQFYVDDQYLDMFCYNRSSDLFLGLPFNIASSSLLLSIIATKTGLTARYLNLTLGDCHIYQNHYQQVQEQISRECLKLCWLVPLQDKNFDEYEISDFVFKDYTSHPKIVGDMVA